MSKLYIVATPIGNLEDLTFRALRILKEADVVLAEDTRVTKKIFERYKIKNVLSSWHQHSKDKDWGKIKNFIFEDKDIALVTDAGSPGVSDPGGKLIELVLAEFPDTEIISVPGSSALTAMISIAGISLDKFLFLGFLPHKKGRQTLIKKIAEADLPVIFFESVHRIIKTLEQLKNCPKKLIIGRELTKQFETVYRGTAQEILEILQKDKQQVKGEFVVVVDK
ncbi:MAG: 16S rRNA (cytidine(1402)-2'-O)-methyltransferase [Candidatus Komeilibacteria bacterium CG11_big_fil_rev_8_21_14_0_20_36_20]|uniref:Ribosomal RNA small subunit methyltransferase I n=1 Tax=Candidatus Komeilibacteria bacterium CG11_big_fil_rev_8_21_14_0_20_36_20 TaxID=1974477 RepID=A0A2H0NDY6_9BACT|nr:MAG: 16S rRNA (cytidine(1402)-2'-O)-methyltransferase [Candidatus Komeilibacteria bacterium CG11_big_fil_rev_8_21_14_0_20_36_20]PIR81245.1 MAG: 16S rRNA (cytidine(1402)-2'-O)-methyltransferase [Candidatus Komeilibacteria bacterium CG10_big_fil_rev_8_21_14_0_10_36_65]PJC55209.1 MAG: 16S rRNA (cytidine(1402)-2'-O)-methyltransferase [Candidatus Komeilibacteria bacterium CG_4_9_14_0_2_um_filter_36_13]